MDKQALIDEYKYKIELHAHTKPVSTCSEMECELFANNFIKYGFDGVAVTNHFMSDYFGDRNVREATEYYLDGYRNVVEAAGDKLSVWLGMEIRFTENFNDYLVYGINENDIEKCFYYLDKGIDVFYKEFKNEKNLIIQAHPCRNSCVTANPKSLDGAEVFNFHAGHNAGMTKAARFAKENNLITSGGIDLHHEYQWDTFAVRCKTLPKDSYELAELIKSEDLIYTVGNSIVIP